MNITKAVITCAGPHQRTLPFKHSLTARKQKRFSVSSLRSHSAASTKSQSLLGLREDSYAASAGSDAGVFVSCIT